MGEKKLDKHHQTSSAEIRPLIVVDFLFTMAFTFIDSEWLLLNKTSSPVDTSYFTHRLADVAIIGHGGDWRPKDLNASLNSYFAV